MPRDCPDFRIYHIPSLFLNQHHSLSSNELDTNVIFFPPSFVSEETKALQTYSNACSWLGIMKQWELAHTAQRRPHS